MHTDFSPDAGQFDRVGLLTLIDHYLEALVMKDPAGLPLAKRVKFTENTAVIPVGDGLWVGASKGPATFRIYAADVPAGQVGFFGVMEEFGEPILLALRLKVASWKITEIEHVVARRLGEAEMDNLVKPRLGFSQPVPASKRVSRQEMLMIANAYFESIEKCNGDLAPFAANAARHENGKRTTTNKPPDPALFDSSEIGQLKLAMARIDALGVRDQMSCRILSYITRIQPRRLLIVDEEMGLVYGFPMFVHRGNVRTIQIIGVPGVDTIPMRFGPFNLQAGEIFKIRGGQIHEIEANGCVLPYGSRSGWDE
jgi:hypothetical protein